MSCYIADSVAAGHNAYHIGPYVGAYALVLLLGELFGTMLGHGMGYFVSENDGQAGLILGIGKQSVVDYNLSAGHTESVGTLILHEIKLPLEIL